MRCCIVLLVLFLCSCDCYRVVTGTVVDENKQPLANAIVINQDKHWKNYETDSTGKFQLSDITGGTCPPMKVQVAKPGYETKEVLIRAGQSAEIILKSKP